MKESRYGYYAGAGTTSPGAGQGDFHALHLESRRGFARYKPSPPLVRALVFIFTLLQSSLVEAVTCPTCVDTIPGCTGGADCPLLKGPVANAGVLTSTSAGGTLDVSKMLPPEMLCTFTRPVMEAPSPKRAPCHIHVGRHGCAPERSAERSVCGVDEVDDGPLHAGVIRRRRRWGRFREVT